ncbi:MAG: DegV family protein, partial [Gammaproteobacteria bacterium]
LRRGGRIGTAAAAVGTLLGMRPLLTVRDGRVEVAATVRTRRAARERLVDSAAAQVALRGPCTVAVHHLGRPDLGEALAAELHARLALGDGAGAAVLALNHATAGVRPLRGALSVASSHVVATEPVPDVLEALRLLLKGEGFVVETVNSPAAALRAADASEFDAALIDLNYTRDTTSAREGMTLLGKLQALDETLPVIVMTA